MSDEAKENKGSPAPPEVDRRTFLSTTTSVAMAGGLVAGYGMFAAMAGRFLYPSGSEISGWVFVAEVSRLKLGGSLVFRTPGGAIAAVARRAESGQVSDFIALSSTCPHLGCQVHWEENRNRFFCPCHNGTFDPSGKATGGPPFQAGQSLSAYPLKVENGLLFIEVPLEQLALREGSVDPCGGPPGPGHDPCLFAKPRKA
jgi:Rieske Fe-S protein